MRTILIVCFLYLLATNSCYSQKSRIYKTFKGLPNEYQWSDSPWVLDKPVNGSKYNLDRSTFSFYVVGDNTIIMKWDKQLKPGFTPKYYVLKKID